MIDPRLDDILDGVEAIKETALSKQDTLVSGTNIKTINEKSVLGSGNLDLSNDIVIDDEMSQISENPVQNKVVRAYIMGHVSRIDAGLGALGAELEADYNELDGKMSNKQNALVSGVNIKTVNEQSLLGSGNLDVGNDIDVDAQMSDTSENPVQNKAIKSYVDNEVSLLRDDIDANASDIANMQTGKQDALVSGTTIKTINSTNILSAGNIELQEPLTSGTNIKTINGNSILGSGDLTIEEAPERLHTFNEAYAEWCSGSAFPILFCGDSTIAGYNTSDTSGKTKAWVKKLEEKLRYECVNPNVKLYNAAVSGTSICEPSQFDTWLGTNGTYADAKMVGIGWGINDRIGKSTRKQYYLNVYTKVEALINKALSLNVQPFLITSQATSECGVATQYASTYPLRTASDINICANNAKRDLAKKYNLEIIDLNVLTELYLTNSNVPVNQIISDRLHFGDLGNLFESGAVFSCIVSRTINVENRAEKIINYSNQNVTHAPPEEKISYGGDLKVYMSYTKSNTNDIKIFDAYVYVKDFTASVLAYKNSLDSSTYIVIDGEWDPSTVNLTELETELDDLELGLHHFEVYTGQSTYVDFTGFIVNKYNVAPPAPPVVNVISIAFDPTTYTVGTNQLVQTNLTFNPENATNKNVTYSATGGTIYNNGQFESATTGTYRITATSEDGNKQAMCDITVIQPIHVTGVSLNETTATMQKGDTLQLTATITPNDATDKSVTWSASNNSCSVDQNGNVTCLTPNAGTCAITVTTNDGAYTATCNITITQAPQVLVDSTNLTGTETQFQSGYGAYLYPSWDKVNPTTALSGKTLTAIKLKVASAGTIKFNTFDLSTNTITGVEKTVTIESTDIENGWATVQLDNMVLGQTESLLIGGSSTARPYFTAASNVTPPPSTSEALSLYRIASSPSSAASSGIIMKIKIWGNDNE